MDSPMGILLKTQQETTMTHLLLINFGTCETIIGPATLLLHNSQRLLVFPEVINPAVPRSLNTYYSTLIWPQDRPLDTIAEFQPGPALLGADILAAHRVAPRAAYEIAQHFVEPDPVVEETSLSTFRPVGDVVKNVLTQLLLAMMNPPRENK
jgi:hypothetical protein